MTEALVSLAMIALVAAATPFIAHLIPGRPIPETVFLLAAGALLGPYLAGAIQLSEPITLLSDLGLAFLFLLAGYEINPKNLTGRQGKHAFFTWLVSLALAFGVVAIVPSLGLQSANGIAIAIALTTTALGTLMPILKERGIVETPIGTSILAYGTFGELGPVIAMALLLSTRAKWQTVIVLVGFMAVAVLTGVLSSRASREGGKVARFLNENSMTTSQVTVRVTVLLLVALIALSAVFDLDIVLGAFAAGFVLRYVLPKGDADLEHKLDGIAYGFLIPVFFVASGAKIDLGAVFAQPVLLVGFILMLLLIRTVPILASLSLGKETRRLSPNSKLTVALYCTTALPVIVAVTAIAVQVGAMEQETASVLVSAGAITVFLMPFLASLTYRVVDTQPVDAVRKMSRNPRKIAPILRDHLALERMLATHDAAYQAVRYGKPFKKEAAARKDMGFRDIEKLDEERRAELEQKAEKARASDVRSVALQFAREQARRLNELENVDGQRGEHHFKRMPSENDE